MQIFFSREREYMHVLVYWTRHINSPPTDRGFSKRSADSYLLNYHFTGIFILPVARVSSPIFSFLAIVKNVPRQNSMMAK